MTDHEQFVAVYEAMVGKFDLAELELLTQRDLGEKLDNVVGQGAMGHRIFQLIEWCGRNGHMKKLVRAIWRAKNED